MLQNTNHSDIDERQLTAEDLNDSLKDALEALLLILNFYNKIEKEAELKEFLEKKKNMTLQALADQLEEWGVLLFKSKIFNQNTFAEKVRDSILEYASNEPKLKVSLMQKAPEEIADLLKAKLEQKEPEIEI